MSFGNILGQIMQQGLGGQTGTRGRLQQTADNMDQGDGLQGIFGQLQEALGGAGGPGGAVGGFADRARDFLRQDQVGSLSGAQIGGIGAAAGALLGGGLGGAARGGAMAVLGTLALGALKRAQAAREAGAAGEAAPTLEPGEIRAVTDEDSEKLVLKAMIAAAKADGQIDQAEMQKIIGKISSDQATAAEKQFVLDQMAQPLDVAALAAEARNPAQAAQVYAASILAIHADTDQEKAYLRQLAQALGLAPEAVAQLHQMTGVPA
ncbi:tellurite resistance TerB family protein [Amaricoccus sp.]|uniref:tellurite resistance TerB family protein n=1 Tax=Amaricoccus sp. TaxID=1872485 RepID=UPI0026399498|nr:tellurite resistance TerB family protein [Amaricoccus sp.]HRO13253.1 tellurite resistance TerB family protein [Amaricoccus sp.]